MTHSMALLTTGGITAVTKPMAAGNTYDAPDASHARLTATAAGKPPLGAAPAMDEVQRALDLLRQSIKPVLANSLEFQIDQSNGKTIVKVIDTESSAVVRQIPSEELLTIARALDRMQGKGGLVGQEI